MSQSASPWLRVLAEGAVIVVSILLALAGDAWWDTRQQTARHAENMIALQAELTEAVGLLQTSREALSLSRQRSADLLQLTGPEPPIVSPDSLIGLLGPAMGLRTPEVATGVVEGLLRSGDMTLIGNTKLRSGIAQWPAMVLDVREGYEWMRADRDEVWEPLVAEHVPLRELLSRVDEGPSRFPYDVRSLLSDPRFEARLAERVQASSSTLVEIDALLVASEQLLELVELELQ